MDLVTISTILFLLFLSCVLARAFSFSKKDDGTEARKEFLANESLANATRRADISSLDYINIPLSSLPLDKIKSLPNEDDQKLSKRLEDFAKKKILNLSGYSNTELKLMYGPANLEELSNCDANFSILIKLLDKIGSTLYENNDFESAKTFLEYSLLIGSDLSNSYVTLGNIYALQNDKASFKALRAKAAEIKSLSRDIVVRKLKEIKF